MNEASSITTEAIREAFAKDPVLKGMRERVARFHRAERQRYEDCMAHTKRLHEERNQLNRQRAGLSVRIRTLSTLIKNQRTKASALLANTKGIPYGVRVKIRSRQAKIRELLVRREKARLVSEFNRLFLQNKMSDALLRQADPNGAIRNGSNPNTLAKDLTEPGKPLVAPSN